MDPIYFYFQYHINCYIYFLLFTFINLIANFQIYFDFIIEFQFHFVFLFINITYF